MTLRRIIGITIIALSLILTNGTAPAISANQSASERKKEKEEPVLCPVGEPGAYRIIEEFPYVMHFEDSWRYPEGPRTCTYRDKRELTYWCKADPGEPRTALNVISNSTSKRLVFKVACDGKEHHGNIEEMYGNLQPPYHVHWHMRGATWDTGYLRIS